MSQIDLNFYNLITSYLYRKARNKFIELEKHFASKNSNYSANSTGVSQETERNDATTDKKILYFIITDYKAIKLDFTPSMRFKTYLAFLLNRLVEYFKISNTSENFYDITKTIFNENANRVVPLSLTNDLRTIFYKKISYIVQTDTSNEFFDYYKKIIDENFIFDRSQDSENIFPDSQTNSNNSNEYNDHLFYKDLCKLFKEKLDYSSIMYELAKTIEYIEENDEEANLIELFSSYRKRKANKHLQQSNISNETEQNNTTIVEGGRKTQEPGQSRSPSSPKRYNKKAKLDDSHLKSSSTCINMSTPFNNKTQLFVNSVENQDILNQIDPNEQTAIESNQQMDKSEAFISQTIHLQLENSDISISATKSNSKKREESQRPTRVTRKKLLEDSRNNLLNSDSSTDEDNVSVDLDFGEALRAKPSKKKEMTKKNRLAKNLRNMNLTYESLVDSSDNEANKTQSSKKKAKYNNDSEELDAKTPKKSKDSWPSARNSKSVEADSRRSPRNKTNESLISIKKTNKSTKSSAQYDKETDFEVESVEKSSSDDDENSRTSLAFNKKNKQNSPKRKGKRPWNETETLWLIVGVELYEKGSWIKILKEFSDKFENRSSVDLKDKYRNLTTNATKLASYQKQARIILKNMQS